LKLSSVFSTFQPEIDVLRVGLTGRLNIFLYVVKRHPKITSSSVVFMKINGVFLSAVTVKVKHPWAFGWPRTGFLESSEEFAYLFMRHRETPAAPLPIRRTRILC
jgi:hypothetical protein